MAEIYEISENPILNYPEPTDYTITTDQIVRFFGRSHRHFCSSTVNKYLFSWDNDFFTIQPIRSQYRVIGRCDTIQPLKRLKDFDVFYVGTFEACRDRYHEIISSYVLIV